jgi:hypothetical protein
MFTARNTVLVMIIGQLCIFNDAIVQSMLPTINQGQHHLCFLAARMAPMTEAPVPSQLNNMIIDQTTLS